MRTHPDKGHGNASINNMYEFAKVSCDLLKTDLTDFFEAWGFFVTGTFEVGDYANYRFEITPKMVEDNQAKKNFLRNSKHKVLQRTVQRQSATVCRKNGEQKGRKPERNCGTTKKTIPVP